MKLRIAELNIEIHHSYPYLERLCRAYRAEFEKADLTVSVSAEEIEAELKAAPDAYGITPGVAEATCAYRQIAMQLPHFDGFVFHASVLACDGVGYAFAAASGTGKSTHTTLWQKAFGERVTVINGDKPILRFVNGQLTAFGTPWQGKENWGSNASAPLAAICFLERGSENQIRSVPCEEAVARLFGQILMPTEREAAARMLELLDRTLTCTPAYLLHCNTDLSAAAVAFEGMSKGEEK